MKISKASKDTKEIFGVIKDEFFFEVSANFKNKIPTILELMTLINRKINNLSEHISELDAVFEEIGHPLPSIKLLPPTTEQNKIICVGINYPKLYNDNVTKKPDNIILFSKFYETLVGDEQPLLLPLGKANQSFDYEGEVAVVIGTPGFNIREEHVAQHILGLTLFNDGSVREWQNHSIAAGKNFYNSG